MKAQFITTPNGEELAILPRAEYEALVARAEAEGADEDAADLAMYDARKAELTQTAGAMLPAEVSAMVLRGVSLAAALRKKAGLTQQEVASKIGCAQGYISELENGRYRCAGNTVVALAELYDVSSEWLMDAIGPNAPKS